jgi:isoleucyl-tRNA synthetase
VRQPLETLMVAVTSPEEKTEIESIQEQLAAEINVKGVKLLDDNSDLLVKEIKPNFKTLGPRFGKEMGSIAGKIKSLSSEEIKTLEQEGHLSLFVNEKNIILDLSDVEISSKDIEGWLVAHGNGLTVALDISLTETLIDEGIARELVNRIQNIRKDSGFAVTDKINISFSADEDLKEKIINHRDYILSETLGENIDFQESLDSESEVVFENMKTLITIKKI